jgi:hypothetical protein
MFGRESTRQSYVSPFTFPGGDFFSILLEIQIEELIVFGREIQA